MERMSSEDMMTGMGGDGGRTTVVLPPLAGRYTVLPSPAVPAVLAVLSLLGVPVAAAAATAAPLDLVMASRIRGPMARDLCTPQSVSPGSG